MDSVIYRQRVTFCGKAGCRPCAEGKGHGPYWYAYRTHDGHTTQHYVGKTLPSNAGDLSVADLAQVRLYTLGQLRLQRRTRRVRGEWYTVNADWEQHTQVLLEGLVSSHDRSMTIHEASELLGTGAASTDVQHTIESLRQILEPTMRPKQRHVLSSRLVYTTPEQVGLAEQARLWIDADAFEELLQAALATDDPPTREQLLEEAMLLYRGDYLPEERTLPGVQAQREALRRKWVGMLLELADLRALRGNTQRVIETLDHLLAADPANEAAIQRLMIVLAQANRRGEALHVYKRLVSALERENGTTPSDETRMIYEAMMRQGGSAQTWQRVFIAPRTVAPSPTLGISPQIGRTNQNALVGRDHERAAVRAYVLEAEQYVRAPGAGREREQLPQHGESAHYPQFLLLLGEAGIGKTRLAEEAAREARERSWIVLWTQAHAQESSIPYQMWVEILRMALSRLEPRQVVAHPLVYQSLRVLLPELHDLLPQVAPVTSLEQERLRLWEAARMLLTTSSEHSPLFIVLDDLQWADRSSCELLAYLVRQLRGFPLMIVGTCRESELSVNHPLRSLLSDLKHEQAIETLTIKPLTDEQIGTLVADLPTGLIQHIQSLAAGSPFFAEELARGIKTQGIEFIQGLTLPHTISAVLDLRLARLSAACQRLLARAAVLGGSFELNTILVMEAGGPDAAEDTILDLLEEALQAGMLTEEGSGTRITYHFWHPLLVSHLYDGLSAGRRASLHRRAAEVLRQAYQGHEREGAAAIVYHLVDGGAESPQIAYYAELAGDRAYRLSAYPEAERHYRLAAQHSGTLPANASREEWTHLGNLLERLGESTRIQGKDQEARHYFEQALDARSRQRASHANAQYEVQIDALLWCLVGKTWFDTGDYPRAQECYRRGEQVLREAGIQGGPAWANLRIEQGYILWRTGNFEQARISALAALETFGQAAEPRGHNQASALLTTVTQRTLEGDPVDLGRAHRLVAAIALTEGDGRGALEHLNLALRLFEQYDRQREIAHTCDNLGDFYLRSAQYEQAQEYLRRGVGIAERIGDTPLRAVGTANLGVFAARLGDLAQAEASLRRAIELAERVGDPVYQILWWSFLTLIAHAQGKDEEAVAMMCRALALSRTLHIPSCTGFALAALGQMRLTQAGVNELKLPQGDNSLRSCVLLRARGALRWALAYEGLEAETIIEVHLALAEVSQHLGEVEEARQQALEALEEARRYELTWLLARGQRLLGSILAVQKEFGQAAVYFEQAVLFFRERGMRLEWARTLQGYGGMLLQADSERNREQGARFLQEAQQGYAACGATLDLQMLERTWGKYLQDSTS